MHSNFSRCRTFPYPIPECSFHEKQTSELNALIRKYNNAAPYSVRKPYIQSSTELDSCFQDSAPIILKEFGARIRGEGSQTLEYTMSPGQSSSVGTTGSDGSPARTPQKLMNTSMSMSFSSRAGDVEWSLGFGELFKMFRRPNRKTDTGNSGQ